VILLFFFSPLLPDLQASAAGASSNSENLDLFDEDPSFSGLEDTQQASTKTQLEVHIAGLKIAEDWDAGDDADIDIIDNCSGENNVGEDPRAADTGEEVDNIPNDSAAFKQFKVLLQNSVSVVDVLLQSAQLMDMLTLGCDKCSITMDHKFKSRTERWFTAKMTLGKNLDSAPDHEWKHLVLRRDSIIELHVWEGGQEHVLEYSALSFFTMYFYKWFVSIKSEFPWVNDKVFKKPKGRGLARLAKMSGAVYQEVKLETFGEWAPQHVFRSVLFDAILTVSNDLVEM